MTFLELVNRLKQETGVAGADLTAVTSQTGESARLVSWIKDSYEEICGRYDRWKFLRSSFTVNTVADTQAYAPTACSDNDALNATILAAGFSHWLTETFRIYKSADGVATQRWLPYRPYEDFRNQWLIGSPASGPPSCFSLRPRDSAILLGAKPDAVYVVTGDYQRIAVNLSATGDTPIFDARFHMVIVWNAIIKYMGFEEDGGGYDHASREYNKLNGPMERKYLPQICLGGPLA